MPAAIVHVVDDDASFLRAASRLLRASGFTVETYLSADEFLARPLPDKPGCIISDLNMPGKSGLELQTALSRRGHAPPMIFLTGAGDIPSTVSAIQGGAVDFLEKHAPLEKLLEAVSRALAQDQRDRSERAKRRELGSRFCELSARELEVLGQVVRGSRNKEIAAALGIHERTVKLHRTAITTKLRVRSVAELTRIWLEAGNAV
jgi:FixJ family two-component response regulator